MTGTLQEDQYTFLIIFRTVFRRMKNVLYENGSENRNTHLMSNNFFFFSKIVPFTYEILLKIFCNAEHASDNNVTHAHCMLDT